MNLHFKQIGQGPPLIILHGLFGMLDNWMSIAQALQENFSVYLIDLRNHGKSPHSDEFNYSLMAQDVCDFMDSQGILSAFLMGHSMGGKVAMTVAQYNADYVDKLVVVDIAPKKYYMTQDLVLEALKAVDFNMQNTRKQVEEVLRKYLKEEDVLQFLLKNLYWKENDQLSWRFNLSTLSEKLSEVGHSTEERVFNKPTLFVKGAHSNYILPEDELDIKVLFPLAEIISIANSGHWVHAENPLVFTQELRAFLNKAS